MQATRTKLAGGHVGNPWGQRNQEGEGQRYAQAWRIWSELQRPTAARWASWRPRCAAQRSESSLPGLQAWLLQAARARRAELSNKYL
jgi:hypothetical protein